jgi:NAD-dependent deacetylase
VQPDPHLVELLTASRRTLFFTGAGISTGSGIQDYRGPDGVWKTRRPVYYQNFLTSHEARVESWDQKLASWPTMRDAAPNPTHHAIARLEADGRVLLVATQNIDGLHARAGTSPERLVELHGTALEIECLGCGTRSKPDAHLEKFRATGQPPVCDDCGGLLKSATISFGQSLRQEDLGRAFAAAKSADLVIALGSTLSVQPAASLPLAAAERGVPYVIINRGPTEHDGMGAVTLRLDGDVSNILPPAVDAVVGARHRPQP